MFFIQMFLQEIFPIIFSKTYSTFEWFLIKMSSVMIIVVSLIFEFLKTYLTNKWCFFCMLTHMTFQICLLSKILESLIFSVAYSFF